MGMFSDDAMTLEEARAYCFACHFTPSAMAQDIKENGRYLKCKARHQYYDTWLGEYFDLVFEKLDTPGENVGLWFYNFHIVWGQMSGKECYKRHLDKLYSFLKGSVKYSGDIRIGILRNFFNSCPCYSGYWHIHMYEGELPRFKEVIAHLVELSNLLEPSEEAKKYERCNVIWKEYEGTNRLEEFAKERKRWEQYC